MIHEAGHLAAAKIFRVYCFDYSIGFGPAFLHVKRKGGETYFSLRAIPFGGFVSMYGEGQKDEIPEGVGDIPVERSLNRIKKWKRAIILAAGVIMNSVLALVLFFISACLPQQHLYLRYVDVASGSKAEAAGIVDRHNDNPTYIHFYDALEGSEENRDALIRDQLKENHYVLSFDSVVTFTDSTTKPLIVLLDVNDINFKHHDYDDYLVYYTNNNDTLETKITSETANVESVTINIHDAVLKQNDKGKYYWDEGTETFSMNLGIVEGKFESTGLTISLFTDQNSFIEAVKQTFVSFGESSTLIVRALGNLFIGRGWDQVGGIVAIYSTSTSLLSNYNVAYFIQMWGIISVNLAIFNLLPFPGLDGWQLVVLLVEAIAHKEIPQKVKAIISIVGVAILVIFMLLILIKDVIGLF